MISFIFAQVVSTTLVRSPNAYGPITVGWRLLGTSLGADPEKDFLHFAGEVRLEHNQSTATLSVHVADDAIPEIAEHFTIELTSTSDGDVSLSQSTQYEVSRCPTCFSMP